MKKLSKLHYYLIENGVKSAGTFDPNKIFCYFEETLTFKEAEVIRKFLTWVHADVNNRCFGSGNYQTRFEQFLFSEKTIK